VWEVERSTFALRCGVARRGYERASSASFFGTTSLEQEITSDKNKLTADQHKAPTSLQAAPSNCSLPPPRRRRPLDRLARLPLSPARRRQAILSSSSSHHHTSITAHFPWYHPQHPVPLLLGHERARTCVDDELLDGVVHRGDGGGCSFLDVPPGSGNVLDVFRGAYVSFEWLEERSVIRLACGRQQGRLPGRDGEVFEEGGDLGEACLQGDMGIRELPHFDGELRARYYG